MLLCSTCKECKPSSEFSLSRDKKSGHASRCKECRRLFERDKNRENAYIRYQANKEMLRERVRVRTWKTKFGISPEQYDEMLKSQNGCCAICKRPYGCEERAFSVDHDHKTGKVRGLLCSTCNRGIGMLRDDPDILRAAIRYLEQ